MKQKKTLSEKAMRLIPDSRLRVTLRSRELMNAYADKLNAIAESVPAIGETENKKDAKIALHYFFGGIDFYVLEFDGNDTFFGYMILNGDYWNSEYGYQSRSELFTVLPLLNLDYHFKPVTVAEIKADRR
jgi:hypothetical protein